jgi:hypothetical protein
MGIEFNAELVLKVPFCPWEALGVHGWAVRNTERAYLWLREDFDLMHWKSYFVGPREEQKDHGDPGKDISRWHRWRAVVFAFTRYCGNWVEMMIPIQTFLPVQLRARTKQKGAFTEDAKQAEKDCR